VALASSGDGGSATTWARSIASNISRASSAFGRARYSKRNVNRKKSYLEFHALSSMCRQTGILFVCQLDGIAESSDLDIRLLICHNTLGTGARFRSSGLTNRLWARCNGLARLGTSCVEFWHGYKPTDGGQGSKNLIACPPYNVAQPSPDFSEIGQAIGWQLGITFQWQNVVPLIKGSKTHSPKKAGIVAAVHAKLTPAFLTELRPVGGLQQPMLTIAATAELGFLGRGKQ